MEPLQPLPSTSTGVAAKRAIVITNEGVLELRDVDQKTRDHGNWFSISSSRVARKTDLPNDVVEQLQIAADQLEGMGNPAALTVRDLAAVLQFVGCTHEDPDNSGLCIHCGFEIS